MKHFDPDAAQRVWQRVRASLEPASSPIPELPPIPIYTTPPEAWQIPNQPTSKFRKPALHARPNYGVSPWLYLIIILWILTQK